MNKRRRPNVLLIYTDQQRTDTLSCYGQEAISTPNIDALAKDGALFSKYFVQNPVCAPSRASFLTGRYCSDLHIGTNGIVVPDEACPVQQILSPYGYRTAQLGKLHFEPHARRNHQNPPKTYGFDTFILSDEPGCYDDAYTKWVEFHAPDQVEKVRTMIPPAAVMWGRKGYSEVPRNTHEPYCFEGEAEYTHTAFVTSQTVEYLEKQTADTPFFAIAGYYAPHPPLNPPKKYVDMVDRSKLRLPLLGKEEKMEPYLADVTDEQWKDIQAHYLAMVIQVDEGVGQLVQTLKDKNLYDDTLIIFTSDHGEFLGDHGRIQKGMPGHDCITNVPCILSYPNGIKGNVRFDTLVEAVDIVPTILDYCGIQIPEFVRGKTLSPLLKGVTTEHRGSALTEFFDSYQGRQTTVRTAEYKYYMHENGNELLYDLGKDPNELSNVANEPAYEYTKLKMQALMMKRIQHASYHGLQRTDEY